MLSTNHQNVGFARRILLLALLAAVSVTTTFAEAPQNVMPADVTQMSMEDLMNVQVTSVSKRQQKLADAAAAIFVITQDDIRRSGACHQPSLSRAVSVARSSLERMIEFSSARSRSSHAAKPGALRPVVHAGPGR